MIKAAILDLYNRTPNLGLKSIMDIIALGFPDIQFKVYDVRAGGEIPDLDYDIYISSGGPGNPMDGDGKWDRAYYEWMDALWNYNLENVDKKKYAFFICHSFQMICHHFEIGKVSKRPEKSFGVFPLVKTINGMDDELFQYLPNPFYVADFREYQVVEPDHNSLDEIGARILAIEHPNNHDFAHQAIMAVRFSPEIYGTQFHPEAFPEGMLKYFAEPDRRTRILEDHGAAVYEEMMFHLRDPIKIQLTHNRMLPGFLSLAENSVNSPLTEAI